jgi:hypothetical protein
MVICKLQKRVLANVDLLMWKIYVSFPVCTEFWNYEPKYRGWYFDNQLAKGAILWDFMSNISSDPDRSLYIQSATNVGVFSSSYSNYPLLKPRNLRQPQPREKTQRPEPELNRTELPFARFKLSSPTVRGSLVAETHETFSPARTLESWVRIPLEAWMFVCVYSVFVLFCIGSGLATGWSLVQGVLPIVYKCKITEPHKEEARPDMGCSAI